MQHVWLFPAGLCIEDTEYPCTNMIAVPTSVKNMIAVRHTCNMSDCCQQDLEATEKAPKPSKRYRISVRKHHKNISIGFPRYIYYMQERFAASHIQHVWLFPARFVEIEREQVSFKGESYHYWFSALHLLQERFAASHIQHVWLFPARLIYRET